MPADIRAHVRYPELMLKVQAAAYSLYHMRDPEVFYNREDLWSVASEVTLSEAGEQVTRPLDPNFVLMTLPGEERRSGEKALEFVEILPFTPSNRNNLIGWIAGRSDGAAYGKAVVYDFPKSRLVDGPLQIEARIDQNPQLSSQLTLWNQQGSHVRRGSLIVIPIGQALLYAKPIYLQAERSPMPQLRLVVLALQDQLGYGPTFEAAMSSLFGGRSGAAQAGAASPLEMGGAGRAAPSAGQPAGAPAIGLPPGRWSRLRSRRSSTRQTARSGRLPAPDGRRQAGRGGPEPRVAEEDARPAQEGAVAVAGFTRGGHGRRLSNGYRIACRWPVVVGRLPCLPVSRIPYESAFVPARRHCPNCEAALTRNEQVVLDAHMVGSGQQGEVRLSALFGDASVRPTSRSPTGKRSATRAPSASRA